jgi:hypothetical protein
VASVPVALIGLALLVLGIVGDSELWLIGLGLASIAILTSAMAVFRFAAPGDLPSASLSGSLRRAYPEIQSARTRSASTSVTTMARSMTSPWPTGEPLPS